VNEIISWYNPHIIFLATTQSLELLPIDMVDDLSDAFQISRVIIAEISPPACDTGCNINGVLQNLTIGTGKNFHIFHKNR
jgi:hypothetical protein